MIFDPTQPAPLPKPTQLDLVLDRLSSSRLDFQTTVVNSNDVQYVVDYLRRIQKVGAAHTLPPMPGNKYDRHTA